MYLTANKAKLSFESVTNVNPIVPKRVFGQNKMKYIVTANQGNKFGVGVYEPIISTLLELIKKNLSFNITANKRHFLNIKDNLWDWLI